MQTRGCANFPTLLSSAHRAFKASGRIRSTVLKQSPPSSQTTGMQLLPLLLASCVAALTTAQVFSSDDGAVFVGKRARVRELLGKRDNGWGVYPVKRARELFGKRSFAVAEKRRPRELFGKRSPSNEDQEGNTDDYLYDEDLLRALNGLKRERRARVRELLG